MSQPQRLSAVASAYSTGSSALSALLAGARLAVVAGLCMLASAGCSQNAPGTCTSRADCLADELCTQGACRSVPSTPVPDAGCRPESNEIFCGREGKACGVASGRDSCGAPRSVSECGPCNSGLTCSATQQCVVPDAGCQSESNATFCGRQGKACGAASGTDNCGAPRSVSECGPCSSGRTCSATQQCVEGGAPGAPTVGAATPLDGSVSVAFSAPANGRSAILSYQATCTSSDGGSSGLGTGAVSPVLVTGLTNGKAYVCTVTATNSDGTSPPSAPSVPVTPSAAGCVTPSNTSIGTLKATAGSYQQTESGTVPAYGVLAFPFTLDAALYPYGIKFNLESGFSSGGYNLKDVSVSSCPGVFDGLASPCVKRSAIANAISTSSSGTVSLCEVIPGRQYYFNLRPTLAGQDTAAMIGPMPR